MRWYLAWAFALPLFFRVGLPGNGSFSDLDSIDTIDTITIDAITIGYNDL